MPEPAVHVENLSKAYRIGVLDGRPDTVAAAALATLTTPFRNFRRLSRLNTFKSQEDAPDILWALKDVSFEVPEGQALGIIGRNGAGKSTLLKVLSRITTPTRGRVRVRGRVSSLLEVGTGFHPELTGRENVFLNGTILGMRRREIQSKLDSIIDFSGVERFLDTPVKRYSSGMKVRLAFAVAAHLEPEILIIDEVLAVGDAEFQRKCLGKMEDISGHGRTVLFVSHNLLAVGGLCQSAMVFEQGRCTFCGPTNDAIDHYLSDASVKRTTDPEGFVWFQNRNNAYRPNQLLILAARVLDSTGAVTSKFRPGEGLIIEILVDDLSEIPRGGIGILLRSELGQLITAFNTFMSPFDEGRRSSKEVVRLTVPRLPLVPGNYWIDISVAAKRAGRVDYVDQALALHIVDADIYESGYGISSRDGFFFIEGSWQVTPSEGLEQATPVSPTNL